MASSFELAGPFCSTLLSDDVFPALGKIDQTAFNAVERGNDVVFYGVPCSTALDFMPFIRATQKHAIAQDQMTRAAPNVHTMLHGLCAQSGCLQFGHYRYPCSMLKGPTGCRGNALFSGLGLSLRDARKHHLRRPHEFQNTQDPRLLHYCP